MSDIGSLSEERLAVLMEGNPTLASGAMDGCKSDFTVDWTEPKLRVECKATEALSMSIKREWLLKIAQEALETGRDPVLTVSFVTGNGQPKKNGDWAMIPMRCYQELLMRGT